MTLGLSIAALRSGAVLVPALLAAALWLVAPTVRLRGAAVLSWLWLMIGLLGVNAVAVQQSWWTFGTTGGMWAGVPVDVIVGWALLWGAVPVLLTPWVSPIASVTVLVIADVLVMGRLEPLVSLRPTWWWGEALAAAVCLLPGVALGVLTARERALRTRAALQVVLFTAVLGFACPAVAFAATGTPWAALPRHFGGPVDLVLVQLAAMTAIVALRAVADFVRHGGTPFPWDPPRRLVTDGPYAYLANPMQFCGTALLLLAAAIFAAPVLVVAAGVAAVFSSGIADWNEDEHLRTRFGDDWQRYRREVRNWLPRWHPYQRRPPARLFVGVSCDPCSALGAWLMDRKPSALLVEPAEEHPGRLQRVRYEAADGTVLDGTRAVGAALEHLSLGYAVIGWLIRAPGIAWFVQLLADAVGAGPRTLAR
jgi:protein-S-isoprenylcysteine O-methyltransferase Ste14